ncbi:MAG TPA: sugar isomerase domain-containing protein [Candidatus Hydrogenedentes bacterium]|nr:sugar isomerase domain-containing protein [Candidatus Hydrogenedentota bacterium]
MCKRRGRFSTRLNPPKSEPIHAAADLIARSLIKNGVWHVFGAGHSHLIAEEAYSRMGGLAPVNAVLFPPLMLHEGPVSARRMARIPGIAKVLFERADLRPGEVLTIISNSGRDAVPIEMALLAREKGVSTVAVTSLAQARLAKNSPGFNVKLFEICDVVIDNCTGEGDAALKITGTESLVGPMSTLAGVAVIQQITYLIARAFVESGREAPVFRSVHAAGGEQWNARLVQVFGARAHLR